MTTTWNCSTRLFTAPTSEPIQSILWFEGTELVFSDFLPRERITGDDIRDSFKRACAGPLCGTPRIPDTIEAGTDFVAQQLAAIAQAGPRLVRQRSQSVEHHLDSLEKAVDLRLDPRFQSLQFQLAGGFADMAFAAPWDLMLRGETLVVQCPSLGLDDARISILGEDETNLGFILLRSDADADRRYVYNHFPSMRAVMNPPPMLIALQRSDDPTYEALVGMASEDGTVRPGDFAEQHTCTVCALALGRFFRLEAGNIARLRAGSLTVSEGTYEVEVLRGDRHSLSLAMTCRN